MSDVESVIEASNEAQWVYLSEGGANIVLSYCGTDTRLVGRCLRLRKLKPGRPSRKDAVDPAVEYQSKVVVPLLGEEYVPWMLPVRIPRPLLEGIRSSIASQRTAERQAEGDVDVESESGVLVEDLVSAGASTQGPVLTFEIKPKWANLPPLSAHLEPATELIKRSFCRTCMLRSVRSPQTPTSTSSDRFCPLRLFSGDVIVVRKAIDSLYGLLSSPEGAGNNFRIFRDGKLVNTLPTETADSVLQSLSETLASSEALRTIKDLQQRFDPSGIEHVATLLETHSKDPAILDPVSTDEAASIAQQQSVSSVRAQLVHYLVSATFKDCSLLVRAPLEPAKGGLSSVKVIDLDPKPMNRLPKYVEVDKDTRTRFLALLKQDDTRMIPCTELLRS